jgi:1,2-diacylglycerol 3-beta-glucosyltransferase
VRRALARALLTAQAPFAGAWAYLLALLAAARPRSAPAPVARGGEPRVAVLVPAHDEGAGVRATVTSLLALDWSADGLDVVVIADNCSDDTAAHATAAGARVLERADPDRPGKGRALAWALQRLGDGDPRPDAVVVVDADCTATPNLLRAFAARWRDGARAVQSRYLVANADASALTAARAAAFALAADVRSLGKDRLGLSCGLLGTGMGFTWELLREHPWDAFGLAEDVEHHLALVLAGERVRFVDEAAVLSDMPTTAGGAAGQQSRWEAGKAALVRRWTPRLVAAGLRERDPVRVHAGLELLVPPQSLLAGATVAGGGAALALGRRGPRRLAAAMAVAQVAFVAGGMRRAGAPRSAWRGLALAPALVVRKAILYVRIVAGRGPREWVRTERERVARDLV